MLLRLRDPLDQNIVKFVWDCLFPDHCSKTLLSYNISEPFYFKIICLCTVGQSVILKTVCMQSILDTLMLISTVNYSSMSRG